MASMPSFTASPPLPGEVETPPLQRAAFLGNLHRLKRLVKQVEKEHKGENIGKVLGMLLDGNGWAVLHMAAANGKTKICKYLIKELRVNVDARHRYETTSLHQAIMGSHYSTAVYLLDNGANVNATCKRGFTSLHYAAEKGFEKLMKLVISRGADINAMSQHGTPLQMAAKGGKKHCVKILLDNHADPNAIHDDMFSPLVEAVIAKSIECVELLLQAGADHSVRSDKVVPLEAAVAVKDTEIIKCLLAAGANPDTRNEFDLTPLEMAAIEGQQEDVLVLFPATAPIPGITDWSIPGIMKYVQSDEDKRKRENERKEAFVLSKSKREAAFKKEDYVAAIYDGSEVKLECNGPEPISDPNISSSSNTRSMGGSGRLNEGDDGDISRALAVVDKVLFSDLRKRLFAARAAGVGIDELDWPAVPSEEVVGMKDELFKAIKVISNFGT